MGLYQEHQTHSTEIIQGAIANPIHICLNHYINLQRLQQHNFSSVVAHFAVIYAIIIDSITFQTTLCRCHAGVQQLDLLVSVHYLPHLQYLASRRPLVWSILHVVGLLQFPLRSASLRLPEQKGQNGDQTNHQEYLPQDSVQILGKLYTLKVVDPICNLKMWDWIQIMVCRSKYHVGTL